jgi:transcriptional regulator with XRE-family HTH domain
MKLAEMLDTLTSYMGEIEINSRVPSLAMVERIANALKIEPFRLFLDSKGNISGDMQKVDQYLFELCHIRYGFHLKSFHESILKGWMGNSNLSENVFSHADCFVAFNVHFGIENKAVLLIKFYNSSVVFYICIYSKKAAGKKLTVTNSGKGHSFVDHVCAKFFIFTLCRIGYGEFCNFHCRDGLKRVLMIMGFFF